MVTNIMTWKFYTYISNMENKALYTYVAYVKLIVTL